jgi:hypothetical protein
MEIQLTEIEINALRDILNYFLDVPRKLWKQHHDYLGNIRNIVNFLDEENQLNLTVNQEKALTECLEFFIYHALPFWNKSGLHYLDIAETILFKKIKKKRFNLISLQYELYNEHTGKFEVCTNGNQG